MNFHTAIFALYLVNGLLQAILKTDIEILQVRKKNKMQTS